MSEFVRLLHDIKFFDTLVAESYHSSSKFTLQSFDARRIIQKVPDDDRAINLILIPISWILGRYFVYLSNHYGTSEHCHISCQQIGTCKLWSFVLVTSFVSIKNSITPQDHPTMITLFLRQIHEHFSRCSVSQSRAILFKSCCHDLYRICLYRRTITRYYYLLLPSKHCRPIIVTLLWRSLSVSHFSFTLHVVLVNRNK